MAVTLARAVPRVKNETRVLFRVFKAAFFSNFDECQPEVADDVISSVAVDYVGILNYTQYSSAVCSRPEAAAWPRHIRYVYAYM